MNSSIKCLACNKVIEGRSDKKFCDPYCKSAYQYKKTKSETPPLYYKIDTQLKKNRQILKKFNKAGKATIRSQKLIEVGFDPNFFTHYWKNQKGDVYLFVYEYGFLKKKENGRDKFVLILWQEYMEQK